MSETRKLYSPFRWILPALILAIIAIATLYIVRNNYTHKTKIVEPQNRESDTNRLNSENKNLADTVKLNNGATAPAHDTLK